MKMLRANLCRLSDSLAEAEQCMDETEAEINNLNLIKDRCQDQVDAFSEELRREKERADGLEGTCRQMRDDLAAARKAGNEKLFEMEAKHRATSQRMKAELDKLRAQVSTGRFEQVVKKEVLKSRVIEEEEEADVEAEL